MSELYSAVKPRQWLMREPSKNAAQETELLFGYQFRVEKTRKGWAYGQEISPLGQDVDGYKGWIKRKALSADGAPRTHYVSALKAPVLSTASIKSRIERLLPMGAQVGAARIGDPFVELASGGYVHRKHLAPLGRYQETDFVSIAARHYGLPYIWGGISTDGLDCSGLVQSALRAVGRDCLRDAGQQEQSLGAALDTGASLSRGDLVFWPGHVGIMEDGDTLLHANAFHMRVERELLAAATARIGKPSSIRRLG